MTSPPQRLVPSVISADGCTVAGATGLRVAGRGPNGAIDAVILVESVPASSFRCFGNRLDECGRSDRLT